MTALVQGKGGGSASGGKGGGSALGGGDGGSTAEDLMGDSFTIAEVILNLTAVGRGDLAAWVSMEQASADAAPNQLISREALLETIRRAMTHEQDRPRPAPIPPPPSPQPPTLILHPPSSILHPLPSPDRR